MALSGFSSSTASELTQPILAQIQQGNLSEAEALAKKLTKTEPQLAEAWHILGGIFFQKQELETAIMYIQKAIKLEPDNPEYHLNLGNVMTGLKNRSRARVCFEKALSINPNFVEGYIHFARFLEQEGQAEEAESHYLKALKINPHQQPIWETLLKIYQRQNNAEQVAYCYRQLVALKPNQPQYQLGLIKSLPVSERQSHLENLIAQYPQNPLYILTLAQFLQGQKRYTEALPQLEKLLVLEPEQDIAYLEMFKTYKALKDQAATDKILVQALKKFPHKLAWWQRALHFYQATNQIQQKLHCLEQVLKFQPQNMDILLAKAQVHMQLGQWQASESTFQVLQQLAPQRADILNALGVIAHHQGQWDQAIAYFQQATALSADEENYLNLVQAYLSKVDYPNAAHALADMLAAIPESQLRLKSILKTCFKSFKSRTKMHLIVFLKALLKYPVFQVEFVYLKLANHCEENNAIADAQAMFLKAYELSGALWQKQRSILCIPSLFNDREAIVSWRQDFEARVTEYMNGLEPTELDALYRNTGQMRTPYFHLAYQGFNDRHLNQLLGQLFSRIFQVSIEKYQANHTFAQGKRLRIGFLSCYFYDHSVSHCYYHMVQKTFENQDEFEVICLYLPPHREDKWTQCYRENSEQFIRLPASLDESLEAILALQVDILVYTDIGMDPQTYLLALHRLAPIQIVLGGHPVTTGLPNIDYATAGKPLEGGAPNPEHNSETRLPLRKGATMYSDMHQIVLPETLKSKAELGLPESGHLYFCPMMLFKVHPDFDALLKGILEGDPEACILFSKYKKTSLHKQLQQRFEKHLGALAQRIVFLDWLPKADFLQVLAQVDVVLDTIHFCGGNTSRISLLVGQPIVTWPLEFVRGRITATMYRDMGLLDLVPQSQADYIEKALKLGTDVDYRQALQTQIKAHNHKLLNDDRGIQDLIAQFKAWKQTPPRHVNADVVP